MLRFHGIRLLSRLVALALVGLVIMAGLTASPGSAQLAAAAPAKATVLAFSGACPVAGTISQGYHGGHDGVDIANDRGTPIYAAGPGVVERSGPASGYGQWIRIKHPDGSVTEYGHMYQRLVSVGQSVGAGQRIALMGSEGQSTGPHLHFEAHLDGGYGFADNPFTYMSNRGVSLPCTPNGDGSGMSFPTWGSGVNIRAEATTGSPSVASLPGPTTVQVQCQVHGQQITYRGITNDAWSYLPDYGGYLSNIFVDVPEAWLPGVPNC